MSSSIHSATVGAYLQILPQIAQLIDKAEAHCRERSLPPSALLDQVSPRRITDVGRLRMQNVHDRRSTLQGNGESLGEPGHARHTGARHQRIEGGRGGTSRSDVGQDRAQLVPQRTADHADHSFEAGNRRLARRHRQRQEIGDHGEFGSQRLLATDHLERQHLVAGQCTGHATEHAEEQQRKHGASSVRPRQQRDRRGCGESAGHPDQLSHAKSVDGAGAGAQPRQAMVNAAPATEGAIERARSPRRNRVRPKLDVGPNVANVGSHPDPRPRPTAPRPT